MARCSLERFKLSGESEGVGANIVQKVSRLSADVRGLIGALDR